jgi:tRNA(Ile)-lysidine synthase
LTRVLQQVRRTIRRHSLCPPGTRLLVALSGGSDSVALTLILRELAPELAFTVTAVAHFNHRLRPAAEQDARFCEQLASRLGLRIVTSAVDVQTYAASARLSIEDAARRARYAFLHRAAADTGADRIAVGHTRDDQAETFLLKAIRGAGLTGLGGIYPQRGIVVRPLLDVGRAELRSYLASLRQDWVEDESNALLDTPRNRVRHRILPELEVAYPGAACGLARSASVAREDGFWLDAVGQERFRELAVELSDCWEFDAAQLAAEPRPVQRRLLLEAMRRLAGSRQVSLEHVEQALEVLGGLSAGVDVPGTHVELRRGKLVLQRVGQGSALN